MTAARHSRSRNEEKNINNKNPPPKTSKTKLAIIISTHYTTSQTLVPAPLEWAYQAGNTGRVRLVPPPDVWYDWRE